MIAGAIRVLAVLTASGAGERLGKGLKVVTEAQAAAKSRAASAATRRMGGTISRDASIGDRAFADAMRELAKPKPLTAAELYPPEARAHLIGAATGFLIAGLLNRAATVLGRRG